MAKRRNRPSGSKKRPRTGVPETIGTALGTVAGKLDGWLAQRQEIADELNAVITRAQGMLARLGGAVSNAGRRGRPSKTLAALAGAAASRRTRKRRKMSNEARAKISAAQKARWAKQKAAKKV
jgi:hypothetical protein